MTDQDILDDGSDVISTYIEENREWVENIFQLVFELKRKYGKSIRKKEIVRLNESEEDRSKVSDAYLYLQSKKESILDSALYEDFIKMNELRENDLLEQLLYPHERLKAFADKVRSLCIPITYFSGATQTSYEESLNNLTEEVIDFESLEEIEIFLKKYKDFVEELSINFLGKGDILNIENTIKTKLIGKRIKKDKINQLLTTLEAEVLSKLISEKKIQVILNDDELIFQDELEKESEVVSSSVLLSPKNSTKESE
jgi:hypothetical protein